MAQSQPKAGVASRSQPKAGIVPRSRLVFEDLGLGFSMIKSRGPQPMAPRAHLTLTLTRSMWHLEGA